MRKYSVKTKGKPTPVQRHTIGPGGHLIPVTSSNVQIVDSNHTFITNANYGINTVASTYSTVGKPISTPYQSLLSQLYRYNREQF